MLYSSFKVRLIAVDSNGIPVTEPAILQAAAEQAGIVFLLKDENGKDAQITIQQAMEVIQLCYLLLTYW